MPSNDDDADNLDKGLSKDALTDLSNEPANSDSDDESSTYKNVSISSILNVHKKRPTLQILQSGLEPPKTTDQDQTGVVSQTQDSSLERTDSLNLVPSTEALTLDQSSLGTINSSTQTLSTNRSSLDSATSLSSNSKSSGLFNQALSSSQPNLRSSAHSASLSSQVLPGLSSENALSSQSSNQTLPLSRTTSLNIVSTDHDTSNRPERIPSNNSSTGESPKNTSIMPTVQPPLQQSHSFPMVQSRSYNRDLMGIPEHQDSTNRYPGYPIPGAPLTYHQLPPHEFDHLHDMKRGRRFRRRYNQIVRKYSCSYPQCNKSYGSLNHLNTHIVTKKHGNRKSKADFQNSDIVSEDHLVPVPSFSDPGYIAGYSTNPQQSGSGGGGWCGPREHSGYLPHSEVNAPGGYLPAEMGHPLGYFQHPPAYPIQQPNRLPSQQRPVLAWAPPGQYPVYHYQQTKLVPPIHLQQPSHQQSPSQQHQQQLAQQQSLVLQQPLQNQQYPPHQQHTQQLPYQYPYSAQPSQGHNNQQNLGPIRDIPRTNSPTIK